MLPYTELVMVFVTMGVLLSYCVSDCYIREYWSDIYSTVAWEKFNIEKFSSLVRHNEN